MTNNEISFTALKVSQPIGDFYVAKLPSEILSETSRSDIRRISGIDFDQLVGIQRVINNKRVKQISEYVQTVDASFPNAFILNLNSNYLIKPPEILELSKTSGFQNNSELYCFSIKKDENTFNVIDGQHRLSGLDNSNIKNFDLIIAFYIDLPVDDQAYLFSTINVTQQKVNKSLVFDLFDLAKTRSPHKTAHVITKSLNSEESSPFYRRIKLLGVVPKFDEEILYKAPLSQGTVAQKILNLISDDPFKDRDMYINGQSLTFSDEEFERGLVFREFFIKDKDWVILKILNNYFGAISKTFSNLWLTYDNPISKTIGYGALMKLLVDAIKFGRPQNDLSAKYFNSLIERVYNNYQSAPDNEITFNTFPPSNAGEIKLYKKLREWAELDKENVIV